MRRTRPGAATPLQAGGAPRPQLACTLSPLPSGEQSLVAETPSRSPFFFSLPKPERSRGRHARPPPQPGARVKPEPLRCWGSKDDAELELPPRDPRPQRSLHPYPPGGQDGSGAALPFKWQQ